MKVREKRNLKPIGTAAAVVVAVALTPSTLASAPTLPSPSSTYTYDQPRYSAIIVHGIHRGGGDHGPEESSNPEQQDKGTSPKPSVNKKKKARSTKKESAASDDRETAPTPIQSYISTEKDLYNILGLHQQPRSSITSTDIQKAYRRRCLLTHPDKVPNGDRAAFDKVTEAFTILSDENKRVLYDKFGLDAVQDGHEFPGSSRMTPGGLGDEILKHFFFGSATTNSRQQQQQQQQQQQRKPQNRNLRYQLEVSLEDMYKGSHQTVTISQPFSGSKKTLDIHIPRGIAHGQTIRLPGEVDHIAHSTPADVIFIVVQRIHPIFTRKAHDLALEITLSLSEALCGFQRVITHLDGRKIHLTGPTLDGTSTPMMVHTGDVHVLKGEGMPKRFMMKNIGDHDLMDEQERCQHYGDLYIQFKVELPRKSSSGGKKSHLEENLTMEQRCTLRDLLEKLQGTNPTIHLNSAPLKSLQSASPSDFGRMSGSLEPNDNEEESFQEEDGSEDSFRQGFRYFTGPGSGFFSSSSASTDENGNVQCQQM